MYQQYVNGMNNLLLSTRCLVLVKGLNKEMDIVFVEADIFHHKFWNSANIGLVFKITNFISLLIPLVLVLVNKMFVFLCEQSLNFGLQFNIQGNFNICCSVTMWLHRKGNYVLTYPLSLSLQINAKPLFTLILIIVVTKIFEDFAGTLCKQFIRGDLN